MSQRLLGNDITVEEALQSFVERPPENRDEARQLERWVEELLNFWPPNYEPQHNKCWELALQALSILCDRRGMGPDLQSLYAQLLNAALQILEEFLREIEDRDAQGLKCMADRSDERIIPLSVGTLDNYISRAYLGPEEFLRLRDRFWKALRQLAKHSQDGSQYSLICMLRGMIARANAVPAPTGKSWVHAGHFRSDCLRYIVDWDGPLSSETSRRPVFAPGT